MHVLMGVFECYWEFLVYVMGYVGVEVVGEDGYVVLIFVFVWE